jgi:hypothetical protein
MTGLQFYKLLSPQAKEMNYTRDELLFHLEILPIHKRSAIITNGTKKQQRERVRR